MKTKPRFSREMTYLQPVLANKYVRSYTPYILSLITISIMILFAIKPTISTILVLQTKIEEQNKTSTALDEKTRLLTQAKNNYNAIPDTTKAKIKTALPTSPEVTTLIASLEQALPAQASISAIQIQPLTIIDASKKEAANPHPTLGEVEFSYNISGTYQQLTTAIDNLAKVPRMISIRNLVLSQPAEGAMILSVTGKAFYLK